MWLCNLLKQNPLRFHFWGWKQNNFTPDIHDSLGVSSNCSLFVLSSYWLLIIRGGYSLVMAVLFIISHFSNPLIHYSFFI